MARSKGKRSWRGFSGGLPKWLWSWNTASEETGLVYLCNNETAGNHCQEGSYRLSLARWHNGQQPETHLGTFKLDIRKNMQHWTGYLQREKALHLWWFSRYNWTNPQLTWSNPGNSEVNSGLGDLHRPLPSSTSDSMVSSLQHSFGPRTMLAYLAKEKSRNSFSSELSYALSLGPPCTHNYFQVDSYQHFHAQIAGCKCILKRPSRTLKSPDHLPSFLNIRTTFLISIPIEGHRIDRIFQECGASMSFKCQKEQNNSIQYAV